jgi:prepilin-type N-terminal cleavage/methylation domain-containing protein
MFVIFPPSEFHKMLRNKKGFTLIELLIVVVIIGILAAIAIPKFANTKSKAYVASMKADLRNLVAAEEAFFADSTAYVGVTDCVPATGTGYNCSAGVHVTATADGGLGWIATATHDAVAGMTCTIKVGSKATLTTENEGEPICVAAP